MIEAPTRCLPPGRRMIVLELRDGWGRVRLPDGDEGWVAVRFAGPAGDELASPEPVVPEVSQAPKVREVPEVTEVPDVPEDSQDPDHSELLRQIAELKADARQHRTENEVLRASLAKLDEKARAAAEQAAAEQALRTEEVAKARVQLERLEMALAEAEPRGDELRRDKAALEQEIAALRTEAESNRDRIDDLAGRLRAAEVFVGESEAQRIQLEGQIAALRREKPESGDRAVASEVATELEIPTADVETEGHDGPDAADSGPQEPLSVVPQGAEGAQAEELLAIVQDWARAWSEQRIEDYLSFYGEDFEPENGLSRSRWESQRRARLSQPNRIEIDVAFLEMRPGSATRAEIEFLQSYSSESFSDVVVKTLVFVRQEGAWKIAREHLD